MSDVAAGSSQDRPRILLVDDGTSTRSHVVGLLAGHYQVREVAADDGAMAAIRSYHPDLVLLQVTPPSPDRFGLLRALRADPTTERLPTILLAARNSEELCVEGMTAGADDFLVRPFGERALLARLAGALARAGARREAVTRDEAQLDRKRADAAPWISEEPFRRTFDLGLVGIAVTSAAKVCLEVNDYMCQILGYSREEFCRMTWQEITHPEDLPANLSQFNRVLAGEIDGYTLDKRFVRKDGRFVDTIMSTKCVRRQDGTVDYFVSLVQDVTDRKALLVSEREARSIAEESNRLKDEFLATLSHELRTPINAALMWLHLLRVRTFEKGAVDQAVDAIESSVRAQARLIDDLLDLTRIAAGKLSIQAGLVDISTVVQAAMNGALPAANAKRIPIRLALHTQNTVVSGDPARLQQVFSNLLTNAVKFTPDGGTIDVEVRGADSMLEITLRDTGEGIEPKLLPHVFERFRQADTSTTRAHTGLGLGLAIVKYLVELHGGYAKAESEGKGRGATFVVTLPALCATIEVGKRRSGTNHKLETDLSGVHVLVVDDDTSTQVALAHMLKAYNARADTASSVDEAMTKLAALIPDVLISDISMPGADGFELIREVRASHLHRGLPAIALTALSRRGDRRRALQAGYDMHLAKPIDPIELVAVVASLVR